MWNEYYLNAQFEFQNSKIQCLKHRLKFGKFGFKNCFGFRYSNLGFRPT